MDDDALLKAQEQVKTSVPAKPQAPVKDRVHSEIKSVGQTLANPKSEELPMLKLPSEDVIKKEITKANKALAIIDRQLDISIHEGTNQKYVRVLDVLKNEVVREIPTEKQLDFFAGVLEHIGILLDVRG